MKKIKGEAIIKLKNAKTGKVEIQKKSNIITKIPSLMFNHNIMEMRETVPTILEVFGGMLLFSNTNTVDENNFKLSQMPVGWSGIDTNSISNSGKGYLVPSECLIDAVNDKITITHEWGTSQANGTIASISLTNPMAFTSDQPLILGFDSTATGQTANADGSVITTRNKLFGDTELDIPYYINFENNLIYTVCPIENDYTNLYFRKYKLGIVNRLLWNSQWTVWANVQDYQNLQSNYAVKLEESLISFPSDLYNTNFERYRWVNSLHYDNANNILYIIQLNGDANSKNVKIFKITNPLTTPSVSESEIDLTNIFSANQDLGTGLNNYTYIHTYFNVRGLIATNAIPMKDNYIYLQTQGVKLLKVNITDLSDFRIIDQSVHFDYNSMINDGNLCLGKVCDGYNHTVNVVVDMVNDAIQIKTGVSGGDFRCPLGASGYSSGNYYEVSNGFSYYCFINDAYVLWKSNNASSEYARILMNPAYMATINNLSTPILKTSAQTLTITYTLQEVEVPEEENENENINLGD